jgi:hypothetical protein
VYGEVETGTLVDARYLKVDRDLLYPSDSLLGPGCESVPRLSKFRDQALTAPWNRVAACEAGVVVRCATTNIGIVGR